jgi:fructan beta-fructosidase
MNNVLEKQQYYTEKYRPQYHFSPEKNWMNDPNGMVFYEGEYHLFYQYHPHGTTWGPMHWGHAVSKDLVYWEHLPIGLAPDEHGMIFSGSAVVDWNDSSGFFEGNSGLVAIFTHADTYPETNRGRQRQSIAYSNDHGRTWIKYVGNPVLQEEHITDFRDPKVFWHRETNRWVMVVASGQTIRMYTSLNLKSWEFASEFGEADGSHQGVWECPDLFELPVDKDPNQKKWVLFVSIGDDPNLPEGSRTQYFTGVFDGKNFVNDNSPETVLWIDHGRDNYAGVSWSDVPNKDGRRMYIGWMSNWRYANVTPTKEWRSAMTLPRVVELQSTEEGIRLVQKPVQEMQCLRVDHLSFQKEEVKQGANLLENVKSNTFEILAEFELSTATEFGFKVCKGANEETIVGYDVKNQRVFVDRSHSGEAAFHKAFAGKHENKLVPENNKITLHIFVDQSSVEVFGNQGRVVITDLIFPRAENKDIELYVKEGDVTLHSLEFYTLKSTWR